MKIPKTAPEFHSVTTNLSGGALSIRKLTNQIFLKSTENPTSVDLDTTENVLSALISFGVLAKEDIPWTFPLLPARYHLVASVIERILLNLSDSHTENW